MKNSILMHTIAVLISMILLYFVQNDVERFFCILSIGFWLYGIVIDVNKEIIEKTAFELLTISEHCKFNDVIDEYPFVMEEQEIYITNAIFVEYTQSTNTAFPMDHFVAFNNGYLYKFNNGIHIIPTVTYWNRLVKQVQKNSEYMIKHPVTIHGTLLYIPQKNTDYGEFWVINADFEFENILHNLVEDILQGVKK